MTRFVRTTDEPGRRDRPGSILNRIRGAVTRVRTIEIDGVRYRERRRSDNERSYDVSFPTGERMRIRSTDSRLYDDLRANARLALYKPLADWVVPGMRVLDLPSGTGAGAGWLATRVGPSGGVVALERDSESVRYARRRYPQDNIAHEIAGAEALEGEPDNAFDGALVVLPPREGVGPIAAAVRRVVAWDATVGVAVHETPDAECFGRVEHSEQVNALGRVVTLARCRVER